MGAFLALSLAVLVVGEKARADPIKTDAGLVSGLSVGEGANEVRFYRGIPYAAPPVGELRWRPPQGVTPWQGIRKTVQFGPIAPQYLQSNLKKVHAKESQLSEDCLYLNVNTAAKSAEDRLPVMVWLHAGGLDSGTANNDTYNNPALPRHGVVVVGVNHRLGALGLLAYPDLAAESPHNAAGNYGMLDLIAALQWVKRNIAAFGGDPDRVTIMGQTGGAQKVIWLLASPLAKGLFQRAILESGTNRNLDDNNTRVDTEEQAYEVSQRFVDRIGVRNIAQLRAKTWQEIVKAMPPPPVGEEVIPAKDDRMHATIDAWSLTDHPINIFDEGLGSDVPILIGAPENQRAVLIGYAMDWLPALTHRTSNVFLYLGATWRERDPPAAMSDNIMRMWVAFAATGDPSVEGLNWPHFKAVPGQDQYVSIEGRPEIRSGFLKTYEPVNQTSRVQ
jgi:carboxylesterase type B